jgi:transcriptional regulator with XRE-family HTH domain
MSFGKTLKELRESKGLTQEEFSKIISAGQSTVGMYETDKRKPDIDTIKQFAAFFGVTTDYLLGQHDITSNDNDPEIAELLKNNGIEKARLVKEITLDELKTGIELIKTIRKQKTGN